MTKLDKTKVNKLLTDEINKQLNFSISSSTSNNESTAIMQELEKTVYADIDYHLVCDVVLSLLDLQQTNSNEPNISNKNNTNVPNNFINNINLPGFSVVNAHQDSGSSSGSSCHTDDELSDSDDEGNH